MASFMREQRLAQAFDARHNSIGFLRFFLASVVVLGHGHGFGRFGTEVMWAWTRGQENFGGFAVGGFFALSGFLITRSYLSAPSTGRYLWHRFLRIFPGFWGALIVTAFAFAPLFWLRRHGTLAGFLDPPTDPPLGFVTRNFTLTMQQWGIGTLLADSPEPRNFNGSLWTLPYEWRCYLAVACIGLLGLLRDRSIFVLALTVVVWLLECVEVLAPGKLGSLVSVFGDIYHLRFSLFFLVGASIYLWRDRIPISDRFGALAVVVLLVSFRCGLYFTVGSVALAYCLVWLAIRVPLQWFDRKGDFSYGLYIYAVPVQQALSYTPLYQLGIVGFALVSIAATMPLAVASYYLIERPCLRLKHLGLERWRRLARRTPPPEATTDQRDAPVSSGPSIAISDQ